MVEGPGPPPSAALLAVLPRHGDAQHASTRRAQGHGTASLSARAKQILLSAVARGSSGVLAESTLLVPTRGGERHREKVSSSVQRAHHTRIAICAVVRIGGGVGAPVALGRLELFPTRAAAATGGRKL